MIIIYVLLGLLYFGIGYCLLLLHALTYGELWCVLTIIIVVGWPILLGYEIIKAIRGVFKK